MVWQTKMCNATTKLVMINTRWFWKNLKSLWNLNQVTYRKKWPRRGLGGSFAKNCGLIDLENWGVKLPSLGPIVLKLSVGNLLVRIFVPFATTGKYFFYYTLSYTALSILDIFEIYFILWNMYSSLIFTNYIWTEELFSWRKFAQL